MIKGVLPAAYGQTGQCEDNVANICYLREQVFCNGKHLRRVNSQDKVAPGTFYADYAGNAVFLGDNPQGQAVELSKTPTAIESGAGGVTVRRRVAAGRPRRRQQVHHRVTTWSGSRRGR